MALFPNPPTWAPGTPYRAGIDMVSDGSYLYLCTKTGTSGTSVTFTESFGVIATDNAGQTWVCCMHARAAWVANHAYTVGAANNAATAPYPWPDQVVEESALGLWQCIVSGTSGGSAPSWTASPNWPPTAGNPQPTVTDGSVTWALVAYNDE